MKIYEEKEKCCGCTACANACPVGAISMKPDFEGFLYPEVDEDKCISCGLCNRVCPVINFTEPDKGCLKSFVLRTKVVDDLNNSTSGGFSTPLINYVINRGGVVCCASYTDDFKVEHIIIENEKEYKDSIAKIRGSKYVQSNMAYMYKRIKDYLQDDKLVCFIGTTCQTSGLQSFLGREYHNLFMVDLVCHGTPSPYLFKKYVDYQEEKNHSKISEIVFRNKTYGYHSGTMRITFENGKEYYGSARVDYMLKSFFKEIASRPSCYQCKFKTKKRVSDFTIYDAWHAGDLVENLKDDDKGYTNVMVHSDKGLKLLNVLKDSYHVYEVDSELAIEKDGIMVTNSATPHPMRKDYYTNLLEETLPEHINKFIPVTKKDYLIERTKIFFYKMGLTQTLKKLKK